MNSVVLIATHNRVDITTRNIESLVMQGARVYLVMTDEIEWNRYNSETLVKHRAKIHLLTHRNYPLGAKWQYGLDTMQSWYEENPSPLIITGSDDILGNGFIENACRLIEEGNHFIGLRQWYQHKDGKAYKCQYLAKNNQPIGGGRVYSAEMLKAINYQVFDATKDKHLDDLGWANAQKSGLKCLVLDEPEKEGLSIHAIKGNWPVMNPFTIRHPNIKHISTDKSEKVLPNFFK